MFCCNGTGCNEVCERDEHGEKDTTYESHRCKPLQWILALDRIAEERNVLGAARHFDDIHNAGKRLQWVQVSVELLSELKMREMMVMQNQLRLRRALEYRACARCVDAIYPRRGQRRWLRL